MYQACSIPIYSQKKPYKCSNVCVCVNFPPTLGIVYTLASLCLLLLYLKLNVFILIHFDMSQKYSPLHELKTLLSSTKTGLQCLGLKQNESQNTDTLLVALKLFIRVCLKLSNFKNVF